MICRSCLRAGAARAPRALSQILLTRPLSMLLAPRASPAQSLSRSPTIPRALPTTQRLRFFASAAEPLEKPEGLTDGESQVWDKVVAELEPTQLVVQDISGGCGSMYFIDVSSERFRGLNMLKQQRMVNAALGELVKEWHGVQLKTRVP
ncbi:hypothetical protein OQA88_983 [Cercophora sp. LCS_1]